MNRSPRGLTLIELLVGLALSTLVVAAGTTLLYSQHRTFRSSSGQRAVQEAGRLALEAVARSLRDAGYGMDPALTFDFGVQAAVPRPALGTFTRGYAKTWACNGNAVRCRDHVDGPDELVYYARDPLFSRPVQAVTPASITVVGELRQPLFAGQVLQVMCLLDTMSRGYVTVAAYVPAPAVPDATKPVTIALDAADSGNGLPAFPNENVVLNDACFTAGAAVVAKVDRYRYFVDTYDEAGNVVAAQTPGSHPYLMLDQGLRGQDGQAMVMPVAADVEDLQVSYLFAPAGAGLPPRAVGERVGVNAADEAFPLTVAVVPPAQAAAPDAPARTTGHPANIEAVRVSVVLRTPEADLARMDAQWQTLPAAGNRAVQLGLPGYRRTLFQTTVVVRNQRAADFSYPVVAPVGAVAPPGMNLGGG